MTHDSYYAETAYGVSEVPQQERSSERSWIMRFAKIRLPWGNTDEVCPISFVEDYSPNDLRHQEKIERERDEQIAAGTYSSSPYELIDFHMKDDHERFRYALLPASSHFWIYMSGVGRVLFFLFFIVSIPTYFLGISTGNEPVWESTKTMFNVFFFWILGLPLLCWAIGSIVIKHFSSLWLKPSRGPI